MSDDADQPATPSTGPTVPNPEPEVPANPAPNPKPDPKQASPSAMNSPVSRPACPSCGTDAAGRYCAACGCPINAPRLTLPGLFKDAWRQMLEMDGPVVRTVLGLALRPDRIASAYLAGDRKKYLNPAKFCFVAGAIAVIMLDLFGINYFEVMQRTGAVEISGDSEAQTRTLRASLAATVRGLQDYLHLFTILALPVPAVLMRLLFRRSGRTVAEHLALLLYAYGFAFLLQAATVPFGGYGAWQVILIHSIAVLLYATWAVYEFTGGPWHTGALRAVLVTVSLAITSQLMLQGTAIAIVLLGPNGVLP